MKRTLLTTAVVIVVAFAGTFKSNVAIAKPTLTDCYNAYSSCMQPNKKGGVVTAEQSLECEENLDYCIAHSTGTAGVGDFLIFRDYV